MVRVVLDVGADLRRQVVGVPTEGHQRREPGAQCLQVGGDQHLSLKTQLDFGKIAPGCLTRLTKQPDATAKLRQGDRGRVPALAEARAGSQASRRRLAKPEGRVGLLQWLRRANGVRHLPGSTAEYHRS